MLPARRPWLFGVGGLRSAKRYLFLAQVELHELGLKRSKLGRVLCSGCSCGKGGSSLASLGRSRTQEGGGSVSRGEGATGDHGLPTYSGRGGATLCSDWLRYTCSAGASWGARQAVVCGRQVTRVDNAKGYAHTNALWRLPDVGSMAAGDVAIATLVACWLLPVLSVAPAAKRKASPGFAGFEGTALIAAAATAVMVFSRLDISTLSLSLGLSP